MTILKLVLIGSLRIVFMGSLKSHYLCTLFFSLIRLLLAPFPTAMVMLVTMLPTPRREGDNGNIGQAGPIAVSRPQIGLLGDSKG